ncbi:MAG: FAD-dependent oxidoreductase [Pseudomonadota bacterium]
MDTATDVIVVGAGPTGLLLAIELALAGAAVVVLERRTAPDDTIKAGAIGALAGEALERRGLRDAIATEERLAAEAIARMAGIAGPAAARPPWEKRGGHFAGLFLIDQPRQNGPQRRIRGVQQQALECMLGARAAELGIAVRRGVEVVDVAEDADGVAVTAQGRDGPLALRGSYLVGCDGGRSPTRKRAGFAFPGTDPTITGYQAIVSLDHPERLLPLGWRRTPTGMMAYGPIPGRIFLARFDGPPGDRDAAVTREELEHTLRHISGADVRITAVSTATRFTDHARQADSYRRGRILLAGDAAHVHSPFGGQGLNLSLLDAANLGWKLAAVVRGRSPDTLLDSYTAERHPVAARVLANTRAQVALMRPDAMTGALRDVVADVMRLDEGNRFFGDMISGLTTRYDLGEAHPLAGTIAADIPVGDGGSLFALMQDGCGVLVDASDGTASRLAAPWRDTLRCVKAADDLSRLVRPDGCIAWCASDGVTSGLEAALARWFGAARAAA